MHRNITFLFFYLITTVYCSINSNFGLGTERPWLVMTFVTCIQVWLTVDSLWWLIKTCLCHQYAAKITIFYHFRNCRNLNFAIFTIAVMRTNPTMLSQLLCSMVVCFLWILYGTFILKRQCIGYAVVWLLISGESQYSVCYLLVS